MSTPNPDIKTQEDKTKNEDKTTNEDKKKVIDFFTSGSVVEGRRCFKPKRVEIDTEKDKIEIHFDDNDPNVNMKRKIMSELADIGYPGTAEVITAKSESHTLTFNLLSDNSTQTDVQEKKNEIEISFTLEKQKLLDRIDNFNRYDPSTEALIDLLGVVEAVISGSVTQRRVQRLINDGVDVTKPSFNGGSIINRIIFHCYRDDFNFGLLELLVAKGAKPDADLFQELRNFIDHFELNDDATALKNIGRALEIFHKYGFSIPPVVTKAFEDRVGVLDTTDAEKKGFKEFIALMREPLPMAPWAPMPKDLGEFWGCSRNVDTNIDANDDTKEKTSPRAKK